MSTISALTGSPLLPTTTSTPSTSTSPATGTVSSTNGTLAVGGLISGLNTSSIIQGLLSLDQAKIDAITTQEAGITTQETAFKDVEAKLLALQGNITSLTNSQNGLFSARIATSSDTTALTAAASGSAVPGVYQLHINSLAQAQEIAAQGLDTASSSITHGTLQLKIGGISTSITVDSSNDTLQGLADTINSSGAAVSANVVNDGTSDGAFRLVLSAQSTGTANAIQITNNLASSSGAATKLVFDASTIGNAVAGSSNTGTAVAQSNAGAGYTGNANNNYTFTVVNGGTVGTDDNLQLSYTDSTGANTGTITVNHGDVNNPITVAQGITVQFSAGTLVAGNSFNVKAYVPTVQAAADASVTLGSGSGALTVASSSNQLDSLIPGVALNLLSADPTKGLSLTVANDTDNMTKGIEAFVSSYNDLMTDIDTQTSYSSDTKQAGILLGNQQVLTIQDQVRSAVTNAVAGANPLMNQLGALGITTDDTGKLVVDETKLNKVLSGGTPGVTLNDVEKLFALTGSSDNPGVVFISGSNQTQASSTPYSVHITQAADKATITGTTAVAASTVIDITNNTFTVAVDGQTSSALTLAVGTYSAGALAQALQSAINSDSTLVGRSVSVGLVGNNLSITSGRYGSASQVTMQSGTALSALGFTSGVSAQGHDVVGSFVVNGVTETAQGSGQFLLGDPNNANTADLQVRVTLTPAQVGAGTQANVTVSRGIASQLNNLLTNMLDPINGRLQTIDDGFQQSLTDLDAQKTAQTNLMNAKQQALQQQFTAMEQTLAKLQSASNFLTLQASALSQQKAL